MSLQPRHLAFNVLSYFVRDASRRRLLHDQVLRVFDFIARRRYRREQQIPPEISRNFVSYINTHPQEKLEELTSGMDAESKRLVELVISRHTAGRFFYSDEEWRDWERVSRSKTPFNFSSYETVNRDVFVFKCGLRYLSEEITNRIRHGHLIDGGAGCGDSVMMFSEYSPKSIHAFEPSPRQADIVRESVRLNAVSTPVVVVESGLAGENGTIESRDQLSVASTTRTTCIDKYTTISPISLVKLDIEGYEFDAIKGMRETILRDRPILLICLYHTPECFFEIKPYIESLGLGYKFMVRYTEALCPIYGMHLMLIAHVP